MSSSLLALGLLAVFLVFRSFYRARRGRPRPIFERNGIFAGRLTEGLVHALVSDRGHLRSDTSITGFWGSAIIIDRDGACGRLVLYPALGFGRENDLPGLTALAARHESERGTTIVVVGGNETFGEDAFLASHPLRTLHVGDSGLVREVRRGLRSAAPRLVIERALGRMESDLSGGAFPSLDLETARSLVSLTPRDDASPRPALQGVVTTALTVAIIFCFAIEVFISRDSLRGEGAALAIVYRMGGIHQPAILAGEWPRLIAAPFLHFGLIHLFVNSWAQRSLGAPIEYLIGSWRFLGLWLGSAIGASLSSLAFNDTSVSAGASGAIFGLLGAFATFVFFPTGVLPQPVPRGLRNGVLVTLLLNLMISFIPGIDLAAHAGGFLTGALLAFVLVKVKLVKAKVKADPVPPPPPPRRSALRLAVAGVVLAGVGTISLRERADLSVRPPEILSDYKVLDLQLPTLKDFTVSETQANGLTIVEMERAPASPFRVTYKISETQKDEPATMQILKRLRPEPVPVQDSDWIAVSQLGVQNLRAIEIVVVAPASYRTVAEKLIADLARLVR